MKKIRYYDFRKDTYNVYPDSDYYVVFGGRSNGKTTSALKFTLEEYCASGCSSCAYIRRWEDDIKGGRGQSLLNNIIGLGFLEEASKGRYNVVKFYQRAFYLGYKKDEESEAIYEEEPFIRLFALSQEEHFKSTAFPKLKYIIFDEFITRKYELPDEFVKFNSLLSTLIRLKDDVKIIMLANSINIFATSYFKNMGLYRVQNQKIGSIDIYKYGESDLEVCCHYTDFIDEKGKKQKKPSDKYFAFDNPKLKMITDGSWEIALYPTLPIKYKPKDIIYTYFIIYENNTLQCEIIRVKEEKESTYFTYIHRKTTPIKSDKDLVYQQEYSIKKNYRRNLAKPLTEFEKKIWWFFATDRVFYQDNEVGEIVNAYLKFCK